MVTSTTHPSIVVLKLHLLLWFDAQGELQHLFTKKRNTAILHFYSEICFAKKNSAHSHKYGYELFTLLLMVAVYSVDSNSCRIMCMCILDLPPQPATYCTHCKLCTV